MMSPNELTVRWWLLAALCVPVSGGAQSGLTLDQAIERAQRESFGARAAASSREAARQRDRAFGARLLPQVSLAGDLPAYNRSIIPVLQPDGSTLYRAQQQNQTSLNMRIAQRLPVTGGDLFVQSSIARLQIAGDRDVRNWSSTPFLIGVQQELLRPNDQKWDTREQNLQIEVSERQFLEAREDVAITTLNAFFDHYAARTTLENQTNNALVNDTLFTLNKGRYEVGKIGENDLLQSELALLRSRNALNNARLEFDRTLAALRLQLNVPAGTPLPIAVTGDVPETKGDTTIAVAQALRNRAQMSQQELQGVQAKRRINEARLNNGFGATLQASVGYNQSATGFDLAYRDLRNAQRLAVAVQMPLIQWGQRSASIEAAKADENRVDANQRLAREQLMQEAHFAVLQLDQSKSQLNLSAKADTVANKRFEVAKNRYIIGRIGIDNLYIAQNEKDQALQQYVQALRGYWLAYYRLRRATLYDFALGKQIR
ncbi:MAG: TolC family protein [Gemmatimonadaceae bacterium]